MVLKKERKSITMNIIKKLLIPVAIAAMISLSLAGCDKKGKKPAVEQSAESKASDEHPTKEKASDDHPSNEHPSEEHPSDDE
jgi:predicted small lipoprotein YifL